MPSVNQEGRKPFKFYTVHQEHRHVPFLGGGGLSLNSAGGVAKGTLWTLLHSVCTACAVAIRVLLDKANVP